MTDKVQKIREEVERLQNELIQEKKKGFGSDVDDACILELQNVLTYIDSLQEESVSEDFEKIVEEIAEPTILNAYGTKELARRLRNTICGTSVSDDLEEAAKNHAVERYRTTRDRELAEKCKWSFKAGAEWKKKHLWRDAQGDDLPEIDKEVIVLTQHYPLEGSEYAVYFAHRPNPDGWDGKSIVTGKTEHYTPKTYDKGGWNIPDIVYWLDVELPKEIEL